jgi:hypothetical protein
VLTLAAASSAALARQAPPAPDLSASEESADPIVVIAPLNPDDLPVQTQGVAVLGSLSRAMGSEADRFVRCAGLPEPRKLRVILDRGPGDPVSQQALHGFIVRNRACYGDIGSPASPELGVCNPQPFSAPVERQTCRVTYDRGALYERAIKAYAPSMELTSAQTLDRATLARFLHRKQVRDKLRPHQDREYFRTVACMLQSAPQFGRALLRAEPGSEEETAARRQLIGHGGVCVGGAKEVKADPAQFRAYTAEAFHAWLVAAGNRTTLIAD